MREWLELEAWKALAAQKRAPVGTAVRKAYVAQITKQILPGTAAKAYRFTLSTEAVDRMRDTMKVAGWKLDNYRKNPIVLWAHDRWNPPLGQCPAIGTEPARLVADVRFDSDISDFAKMIEAMVDRLTLRAVSVGYLPEVYQVNEERRGYDFLEQELLEFSIVPIPANPEALLEAKAAGIDVAPMRRWAEKFLGDASEEPGLWLPRTKVERLLETLGPEQARTVSLPADAGKMVPRNPNSKKAPKDQAWARPRLQDFTDKSWGDLSDAEKRKIATHFAWANEMPPKAYGSLKFPHHDPKSGAVVYKGLVAAAGRVTQAQGVNVDAIKAHLAAHYKQFDEVAPWEDKAMADRLRTKEGRVLSGENHQRLKDAYAAIQDHCDEHHADAGEGDPELEHLTKAMDLIKAVTDQQDGSGNGGDGDGAGDGDGTDGDGTDDTGKAITGGIRAAFAEALGQRS